MPDNALLTVEHVSKRFKVGRRVLHAVEDVSFDLPPGTTLGLVGESGSGKSTLGRIVLRLIEADAGRVLFQGQDLGKLSQEAMRKQRRYMQVIFQDPLASLNPHMTVGRAIEDALIVQQIGTKQERQEMVDEALRKVGLSPAVRDAFPFELSGGQQQRVGIARALSVGPRLIVCDEPISSLDVSIQVQIVKLLKDLQQDMGLSYIFISHNLGVVRHLSDTVLVLYLGRVVEHAPARELFRNPRHPYTRLLFDSILRIPKSSATRRKFVAIPGEMPSPLAPPPGCPFHPRCPIAVDKCKTEPPPLVEVSADHVAACHLAG
ncbi:MAG: ABC transporter ATP-binding protein [Firmicutes bacterium]|nr:ABC transporter ATP-binding protein [Bacillota bacterium]